MVITYLTTAAQAGDTVLYVMASSGASIGDTVVVGDRSLVNAETRTITGFGSIFIDSPLLYDWPLDTPVNVYSNPLDESKLPRLTIYQLYNYTYYCHPPHVHSTPNEVNAVFSSATITRGTPTNYDEPRY